MHTCLCYETLTKGQVYFFKMYFDNYTLLGILYDFERIITGQFLLNDILVVLHCQILTGREPTRNKEDYIIPRWRLQLFRNSFIPDAIKQWNLLKEEVREVISINSFRKNLQTKLKFQLHIFLLASDILISFIQSWDITVY